VRLNVEGKPCVIEFRYDAANAGALPTLGPFSCQGVQ
jgi:outer membrane usher protein